MAGIFVLIIKSLLAGCCIGVGDIILYSMDHTILSAFLFSIALVTIRLCDLYLWTGKTQNVFPLKSMNAGQHFLIGLFNIVGVMLVISACSDLMDVRTVCAAKAAKPLEMLIEQSFMCGILMTIATMEKAPLWLSVACVAAFILCGFEHAIADAPLLFYNPAAYAIVWAFNLVGGFAGAMIAHPEACVPENYITLFKK